MQRVGGDVRGDGVRVTVAYTVPGGGRLGSGRRERT
jgi:hypothetical protein